MIPSPEELYEVREIKKLMQHMEVMLSMMQARYFLEQMKKTSRDFEQTMDGAFEIDGRLLSFVVSYGRSFLESGPGRTVLKPDAVYGDDEELQRLHHEIMDFRNRKYAHHDDSLIPTQSGFLVEEGDHLIIVPQLQFGFPLDSYERYRPLMKRMDEFLFEKQESLLKKASEKIGREIKMPSGPPPDWTE